MATVTDLDRGTGRTSRQLQAAPQGAVFVWCNDHLGYVRGLVRASGRQDLTIVGLSALDDDRLRGRKYQVVVDHAARLSHRQRAMLDMLR
jgi:hypothetical protein